MRGSVEKQLERWQEEGLLSPGKVRELRASLDQPGTGRGIRIFAAIGAVLVGLGLVLFVASHWDGMGPLPRVLVMVATFGAVVTGAVVALRRQQPRVSEALWLLASLVLGANIFLIAQIFHFSLTYWQGTLRWMIGALVLGWALQSRLQAALVVPLGLLTLGWIGTGTVFRDQFAALVSDGSLRPILPLVGVGLISLSLLVRRRASWSFLAGSCFGWGLALILVTAVVTTASTEVTREFFAFAHTTRQWLILTGSLALLVTALAVASFRWRGSRILLAATTLLFALVLLPASGQSWVGAEIGGRHLPFAAYVVAVFGLALMTVWAGVEARRPLLVNAGMATCAVLILVQYFSWSFALLDRSLAFIIGGLLILGLAVWLERQRRGLLAAMAPDGDTGS